MNPSMSDPTYKLTDHVKGMKTADVNVADDGSGGLNIYISGYGIKDELPGTGCPIQLLLSNGKLQLNIFANINQANPTHIINLDNAAETNRDEDPY